VGRGTLGDDSALDHVRALLTDLGDEEAAEVVAGLIERLRVAAIGSVMERLPPPRTLDYGPHQIRLLVSSTEIGVRLVSAEKEPFTVEWIEQSIEPGDVFYDIGANVGAYSLIAAKTTANQARIFAFEPSPSSFLDLSRNVALNDCARSIVPLPFALWSCNELLTLAPGQTVAGAISRPDISGAAEHRVDHRSSNDEAGSVTIVGVPLDEVVERLGLPAPTHAKIDTDGYEVDVLLGAERTLARPQWRSIIIELDREETPRNDEIRTLLADAGFGTHRRHARVSSPAFPDPEHRPDVYWTFSREVRRRGTTTLAKTDARPSRKRGTAIRRAQRRAVTATLAAMFLLFMLVVLMPEELGDRPYDVFGLKF
jgi:FkbM family methyltransferase